METTVGAWQTPLRWLWMPQATSGLCERPFPAAPGLTVQKGKRISSSMALDFDASDLTLLRTVC